MADSFATQPIAPVNPVIGVRPVEVPTASQQPTAAQTQLAVLPAGTIVEGFVLNRDNQNNPILRTPLGDLQLQSEVFLKTGSQVIFRVDTTTASRARIVTIDGLEPDDYAAQASRGMSADTIEESPLPRTQTQATAARQQPPSNNAALPALLLNKAATANPTNNPVIAALITENAPLPAALQTLASGSGLKVTVLDLQFPEAEAKTTAPAQQLPSQPANAVPLPNAQTAPRAAAPVAAPIIQTFAESLLNTRAATAPTIPTVQQPLPQPAAMPTPQQQPAAALSRNIPAAATPPSAAPTSPVPVLATTTAPTSPSPVAAAQIPVPPAANAPLQSQPIAQPTQTNTPAAPQQATAQATVQPSAAPAPQPPGPPPVLSANAAPTPVTPQPPPQTVPGLQAVVIGHEPDGGNVLHSALGTIKLFTPRPLPVGSTLTLDVKPDETIAANPQAPTSAAIAPPLTTHSRNWPLLSEPQQPASSAEAQLSQPLLPQIPMANNALASNLLGFMAAIKSGDVRQWLGAKALDKLSTDFPNLAARLKIDVEQMQDLWNNSPLQNWSSMLLPINVQGQIQHARLYIRDEDTPESTPATGGGGGQRFIIEVELSHLGGMQFDGFVQNKTTKQFDLVIRTSKTIEPALANEIRSIFEAASHSTGYGGQISFQRGEQNFVRPLADMKGISRDHHTILA